MNIKTKSKVSFEVVINKVIVGAILLSTIAGATTPAYAATVGEYSNFAKVNLGSNITQNYEVSVESAIHNVRETIAAIEVMKAQGVVTQEILQELSIQISELDRAVNLEGKGTPEYVVDAILEAETLVGAMKGSGAISAQAVIAVAKQSLGIESMMIANKEAVQTVTSFSDVNSTHWAHPDIMTLTSKGIISGVSTPVNGVGKYAPNETVSLGQFLAIATRLVAEDSIKEIPKAAHWAAQNYEAAVESGLINSRDFKSTVEALNAGISREDMAYILVSVAKANGETLQVKEGIKNNINDYSSIASNRRGAVEAAYSNGLLVGGSGGDFNPKATLTRAEVAAVFCRVMNYGERPSVVVNAPVVESEIAYTNGVYTGRMRIEKATEYQLSALKTANFYTEGGKYYVSVDLPQLPDGFEWRMSVDAYDEDGSYVFASMNKAYTGLIGKQVVEIVCEPGKTLKDIDVATLSVFVYAKDNVSESMLSHKLSTKAPNQVLRQSSITSSDASWETFSTTGIFNWK